MKKIEVYKEEILNMKERFKSMIEHYDRHSFYTDAKIQRDIENNRKGAFVIEIVDENKNPVTDAKVNIRQISHEFKFGCSLFLLDELGDDDRNEKYKELFKKVFNYGVVPLYWDTLEPEKGKPRFDIESPEIYRRPPIDRIKKFCIENNIKTKGHCLMYNSFNPDWMPSNHRELKMAVDKRLKEIGERYADFFEDVDVLNELHRKYKYLYGEAEKIRNFPISDEKNHVNWCFAEAKKHFPFSTLFWNEGCYETFGKHYEGDKSYYYLMLKNYINQGVPIEGIGMQFHAFEGYEQSKLIYNPVRQLDLFELYSEFGLPIHLSEVSIPSYSNEPEGEYVQAELLKRLLSLWFSQKNIESVVWWNLVDKTAYEGENHFHAGLIRNDMTPKPAYEELDNLINKVWHTELSVECTDKNIVSFNGFYGDYEVEVISGNKKIVKKINLSKENTGYLHHISCEYGLRSRKIVIK